MQDRVVHEEFTALLTNKVTPEQLSDIERAYNIAKSGHRDIDRDGGERYFEHPKRVALILIRELHIFDADMIIAALLHDVVEDTFIFGEGEEAFATIEDWFNKRVAGFVRLLTKEKCTDPDEKAGRDARYFASIAEADEQTQILKCADRLDNLRDIGNCTSEKKRRYLAQTEAHFLELAGRVVPQLYGEFCALCMDLRRELSEV